MELTTEELGLIIRALKSHRRECCVAIDSLKKTLGKEDQAYPRLSAEYYSDIEEASDLIDRIRNG
jgi:hypothetical protein